MDYCAPLGIPLDQFLSWPESSQDAALQWQARRQAVCAGCGTSPSDWFADGRPVEHAHWHTTVCPGCMRRQRAEEALRADQDGTRGLIIEAARGPASECPVCSTPH